MQKITPFLWFESRAEEAAAFYVSIFPDGEVLDIARYGDGTPGAPGSVMTVRFRVQGQEFVALNGGPVFKFTPAISFVVNCTTQEEIDHYWQRLSLGGKTQQCGWLEDRYGISWQIVPGSLGRMVSCGDDERSARVMRALLEMEKLDMATLQGAYNETRDPGCRALSQSGSAPRPSMQADHS